MQKRWPLLFISLGTAAWWLPTCQRSQSARQRPLRFVQLHPKSQAFVRDFHFVAEMTLKLSKVERSMVSYLGDTRKDVNTAALTQNEKTWWTLAMPRLCQAWRCDKTDEWQQENYHHKLGRKSFGWFHEYKWMVYLLPPNFFYFFFNQCVWSCNVLA